MRNASLLFAQAVLFVLMVFFTTLCVVFFFPIFGAFGLPVTDAGISAMMILIRALFCLLAACAFYKASGYVKRRRLGWAPATPGRMESDGTEMDTTAAPGDDDDDWEDDDGDETDGRERNSPESW
ncbi:hypothetical protein OVA24_16970 [Luteolibacter sp. SL250]|uniref:hypothetical protein n=1 Tax=Luteolibacter sp. SL250 TaxID=2995170 RepID=UPI00226F1685|nr:hypothetical protein [Luteolibacter sp. SL250]WAC18926.1 hypothetical protein OVA24_16970 [Luteolibacter sp. SL250]